MALLSSSSLFVVDPDLFLPCVLGHVERTWRGRLSALVAFRKQVFHLLHPRGGGSCCC